MSGARLADSGAFGPVLYTASFDRLFIFGTVAVALGLGALASISPAMFMAVLLVDIWLFASPHVIATYTRIGFDRGRIREHWFLIFLLPPILIVLVTMVALAGELGGLFTLYFVAQTWHVTRQSFGISRAYRRVDPRVAVQDRFSEALIYLFPAWGLLHRCATDSQPFYGQPIHLPVMPSEIAHALGVASIALFAWWGYRQLRLGMAGRLSTGHSLFVMSHLLVIGVAYVWVADITAGWLVVNIWHNLQYLMFVWMQNVRRDRHRAVVHGEPSATDSEVQKPWKSAGRYAGICLVLGALLYEALTLAGEQLLWLGLPTVFILHFTVNFHHYLVDGVIWKRPKSAERRSDVASVAPGPAR